MTAAPLPICLALLALPFVAGCASPKDPEGSRPPAPSERVAAPAQEVVLVKLTGLT